MLKKAERSAKRGGGWANPTPVLRKAAQARGARNARTDKTISQIATSILDGLLPSLKRRS